MPMRVREEMSDEEKYFETKRQRERERERERERDFVWVHDRTNDNEKLCENHKR